MSLTKSEQVTRRAILVKFARAGARINIPVGQVNVSAARIPLRRLRGTRAECDALPGAAGSPNLAASPHPLPETEACPVCFPAAFAVDLARGPRAVVCAKHYWHPVARLFRSVQSLFLPGRGGCLPQNGQGKNPRCFTAESAKGERRS